MSWMRVLKSVIVGSLFSLAGCAAAEKVKDYPVRAIDQPYTVPRGVARWSFVTTLIPTDLRSAGYPVSQQVIPNPFIWETALSDSLSLEFFPLLLRYKITSDQSGFWGIRGGLLGGAFSSISSEAYIQWVLELERLARLSSEMGVRVKLAAFLGNQFGSVNRTYPGIELSPKIAFQASDAIFLELGPSVRWSSNSYVNFLSESVAFMSGWSVPIGLSGRWQVSRQWEALAGYNLAAIPSTKTNHTIRLGLSHIW
ncbi:MAG: hypothetical protein ACK5QT_06630 [Oligoflexia bacterium]